MKPISGDNLSTAAFVQAILATPGLPEAILESARLADARLEVLNLKTNVHAVFTRADGTVYAERHLHNLITDDGVEALMAVGAGSKYLKNFAYMAIGSGTTPAAAGDSILEAELARSTVITPTNPTAATIAFDFTFAAGVGTGSVIEYGLLTADTAGTLLNRIVDAGPVTKGASDALQVTITISNS